MYGRTGAEQAQGGYLLLRNGAPPGDFLHHHRRRNRHGSCWLIGQAVAAQLVQFVGCSWLVVRIGDKNYHINHQLYGGKLGNLPTGDLPASNWYPAMGEHGVLQCPIASMATQVAAARKLRSRKAT